MFGGLGSIRKRSEYFALTSGSRSPVGSSVMKSSLLSMTFCVICGTVDLTTSKLSMLPLARPGTENPGVFVRMYSRVGLMILIVYGPMPGTVDEALNGDFAAGVGAQFASAIANRNLPSGSVSLTVISPVASSDVMPVMSALGFLALMYSAIPSIPEVNEENGPPR